MHGEKAETELNRFMVIVSNGGLVEIVWTFGANNRGKFGQLPNYKFVQEIPCNVALASK